MIVISILELEQNYSANTKGMIIYMTDGPTR